MKKKSKVMILFTFVLVMSTLQSCGNRKQSFSNSDDIVMGSIIVGSLDWKEITTLSSNSPIFENASFVGDVDLPAVGSRCTGFLISEDVLMTNQHCVRSASDTIGLTVAFNHLSGVPEEEWDKYECNDFIGNNRLLDYALVRCQGSPGSQYGYANLSNQSFSTGTSLYVIQQNCDYYSDRRCDHSKKYSEGKITKVEDEYVHNADTLGGSSGSPVFSRQNHNVIAIHHAGRGNNGLGRGIENYAVPMEKIVRHIASNFPGILSQAGNSGVGGVIQNPNEPSPEEPNNSFEDAFEVDGNYRNDKFKIESASDLDYFQFSLSKRGQVSLGIKFSHASGDLDMKLFDSSFNQIRLSQSVSNEEKINENLIEGTYYVLVYGYNGAKNKYSFSLNIDLDDIAKQPNNSFLSSYNIIEESQGEITNRGERDYFYFDVVQYKNFVITMNIEEFGGDLDLDLFDENQRKVGESVGITKIEKIVKSLRPGRYYVVVKGYRSATGSYQLSVE